MTTSVINSDDGLVSGSAGLKTTGGNDGVLQLQSNGTATVTVDASGNVGINTSSPDGKLDVESSLSDQLFLTRTGVGNYSFGVGASNALQISNSGTERMRIDSSGNVGIGTSSPNRLLDIATSNAGGSTLVSLVSATDGNCQLLFGDTASDTQGKVLYNNSGDYMAFNTADTERMRIDSSGNVGVNNSDPDQYVTSGKVVNLTGTANNSGPANLYMGCPSLGRGFCSTEVFGIANIGAATEITRITGTGSNGYRAYFKIIVTGHTGGVANGINIKEYYWDAGTNAPVQISTYGGGANDPVISFDNSTSNVCIVKLASGNASSGFNGVMKVEWLIPIDFASNTWTIS